MIKVLLADDHPVFREGLKQILQTTYDDIVVDEASDGSEVLNRVCQAEYDAVYLDITMPGRNGLEVLRDLKRIKPSLNVLIVSMHPEKQYAMRALKAGASAYLTKNGEPRELIDALQKVLDGDVHFSGNVIKQLIHGFKPDVDKAPHELLSAREDQVMRMIATGKKLVDIAEELALSISTVSTHRIRILRKMNMQSNADIIRYAVDNGLVD